MFQTHAKKLSQLYTKRKKQGKIVVLKNGEAGCRIYTKDEILDVPSFQVEEVDPTGAGDTFFGCALNFVLEHDIDSLDEARLTELLRFANAGASLITTRKGALKVMPDMQEISDLIRDEKNV